MLDIYILGKESNTYYIKGDRMEGLWIFILMINIWKVKLRSLVDRYNYCHCLYNIMTYT